MSHELRFRRLFRRLVLCAAPLPLVVLGIACGDASESPAQNGEPLRCSVPAFSCATCEIIDKGTFPVEIDAGPATLHGADCTPFCGRPAETCMHDETDPTGRVIVCSLSMCSGRRPSGLAPAEVSESTDLGSYFASMAYLEAASVEAFRTLARELTLHGAPRALVRTARRAARDEIRHTRITRALARRHGGALREPRVAPTGERSLQAMATENAVEGCVRETFGALLATYQAEHARDPVIRAAMLRIARDETRHAALAWQVAGWLNTKLDRAARARVTAAARAAALELVREGVESTPDLVIAGLPNAERSRAIARDLFDALEADGGMHPL